MNFNLNEICRRLLKYVMNMTCLYLVLRLFPSDSQQCSCAQTTLIAMIGATVYAVLDMYIPAISVNKNKENF
jgi:hypothetical protein